MVTEEEGTYDYDRNWVSSSSDYYNQYVHNMGIYYRNVTTYETLYGDILCTNVTLSTEEKFVFTDLHGDSVYISLDNNEYPLHLKIKESRITEISTSVFLKFSSVAVLNLNENSIESIQLGAFNGLYKLEELYLRKNKIKIITKGVFNSLANLKVLDISSNLLEEIEENSFHGLTKMEKIILSSNHLTYLSESVFVSQKQIKYLDLSGNQFNVLNESIFSNMSELETLLLNDTNLKSFWSFPSAVAKNIEKVYLNDNSIKALDGFGKNIKFIELSSNHISELNFSLPLFATYINLGCNKIKQIEKNTFSGFNNLTTLNLTHNSIDFLLLGTFKDLGNLTSLDLSSNFLTEIKFGIFHGLRNLLVLKLNDNKFKQLPGQIFYELLNLTDLDISENELSTSGVEDIVDHSVHLQRIHVSNNSFTCELLVKLIKKMESLGIHVVRGETSEDTHVYGISCKTYLILAEEENVNNKIKDNTLPVSVYSYDIEKHLAEFSEKLNNNIEKSFSILLKSFVSKSEDMNNAMINLALQTKTEFGNVNKSILVEFPRNGNSYGIFYTLLVFFLIFFVVITGLLYKLYITTVKTETDVYRVKYQKETHFEFDNEIPTATA